MTQFDEREKAFENKFGQDEIQEFKVVVRTAKLFGLWAAEQMGLKGAEAEAYAKLAEDMAIAKPGHEDIIRKIAQDLLAKGVPITPHRLEHEINVCVQAAQTEIAG